MYNDCENGLEAIKRYITILEAERSEGLRIDPSDPDYFVMEIFAAKITLMFLMSCDKEVEALEAMNKLNHDHLRSGDIYLEVVVEALESMDYSLLEF